jgi:small GTP-binding protein
MDDEPLPLLLKLVALGEGGVGKTSCIRRFTDNSFRSEYKSTIGTSFAMKTLDITNQKGQPLRVQLVIWDMAGQLSYNELRTRYMAGASMGLIAYDVTRPSTFMTVLDWYTKFIAVCPKASVALVANKVDMETRQVPIEAGKMLAKWLKVKYFEVSAKTGESIEDLFTDLVFRFPEVQNV